MEWAGADQDTFILLLAAWTNLGGDNPSGAVKRERERERAKGGRNRYGWKDGGSKKDGGWNEDSRKD